VILPSATATSIDLSRMRNWMSSWTGLPAVVVAQHADASGIEHQSTAERRIAIDPPRGEYAQHVPAGKDEDVPFERAKPRYDPIGPLDDLHDRLAAGTPIAEKLPFGALLMDLRECPPLVTTVIPLEQILVKRCSRGKPGERASLFLTPGREGNRGVNSRLGVQIRRFCSILPAAGLIGSSHSFHCR
jgi:hypothetical protein